MIGEQRRSGRKANAGAFTVIFCAALAVGLWFSAHGVAVQARGGQLGGKAAETQENQTANLESPFYCNTKSLSKQEWAHKNEISRKMRNARVEIKELPNGYAFRYRPGGVPLVDLADWVSSEARCCPFFDMGITVEREGGPVWLTLTGRNGVKEFIRMEFKLDGR